MSFEVELIPTAEDTYESLINQLQIRWGDSFVFQFEDRVVKSLALIEKNPYLYPIVDVFTETRKCVLHKNCSMFYKIQNNRVLITWFWDNRQDPIFI